MQPPRLRTALPVLVAAACGATPAPAPMHHPDEPCPAHAHGSDRGHHGNHAAAHLHDFSDVEAFARQFDDPARDAWQRPADVVGLLGLSAGMTVADLGAGTGYFLPHLSRGVGPSGHVLALDVEPGMVEHMRTRAAREGLTNVEPRVVAADDPGLLPASVDRVLIVNTWHHIGTRGAYAARLAHALRPLGSVWVVDFTRESPHGPPAEVRLTPEAVVAELAAGGLAARVVDEPLPHQYAVVGELPRAR